MMCSKIVSIKKVRKKCDVYDIVGVPKNHNIVANRMVVHNCDEAVRFASGADWARRDNKELKKKLAQIRTKHHLFILCFPLKIYKMEKNYLESFVNYWIDLYARGSGAVFIKDRNPTMDSWRMKEFSEVGSYTEFTGPNQIRDKLKKHPNFWQIVKFPRPPPWLYSKYLKVREKNVYDDENVMASVTREDIWRALMILSLRDIMTHDVDMTINRIILHIKNEYDIKLSKAMVTAIIEDAKQLVLRVKEDAGGNIKDITESISETNAVIQTDD